MQINTKYEIGQHVWIAYENKGEVCIYDTTIISIGYDTRLFYITEECNEYEENQIIDYEDTSRLVSTIQKTMNEIREKEQLDK